MYPGGGALRGGDRDKTGMARLPELERFAARHHLPMISIADLIRYRRHKDKLVRCIAGPGSRPTYGDFTAYVYESVLDGEHHLALVRGEVAGKGERAGARAHRVPDR